jgi:enoyl-CoA hydratase/carnithine racemase
MPTVAVLPGHAFAAGLMTAMMHDYRLMNPHRGFLCLNELDFGAPLKPPMASIFRQKAPNPNTFRTMILESKRYGALEALKEGLLDGLGGIEEALAFIKEMGLVDRGKSGVYGRLKGEMWGETVRNLETFNEEEQKATQEMVADKTRQEEQRRRVDEWERGTTGHTRSKL